ncbi:MAG: hypothetical protein ABIO57_01485 [Candidatus Paceibacterota bacterium]
MKTTIWLTTNDLSSLHAGGIDRMYLWFKEPTRHIEARGLEHIGYTHSFLYKDTNRKICTKRGITFIYHSGCPKHFPINFESTIEKLGGNIKFNEDGNNFGYYIEIPNRNWEKRLALLIEAYNVKERALEYFHNIALGWLSRETNETADGFIREHLAYYLLRTLTNKEVVTYNDMYGHMSYPSQDSPLHSSNILLNMEVEVGIGENEYSYPIWIVKMRDPCNVFGRKNIYVWFEPCRYHPGQIWIGGDNPFSEEVKPPTPQRLLGNWTNTKGRGSDKAVTLNSLPDEIQQIIQGKIKEQKGVRWEKMKIELPFYIKPVTP